eukprot:2880700-Rhodomonas_salina.1
MFRTEQFLPIKCLSVSFYESTFKPQNEVLLQNNNSKERKKTASRRKVWQKERGKECTPVSHSERTARA